MDKETKIDVLIVGAGPAGSVAARTAAELGLNVILVEKRKEIGVPVRTTGVTSINTVREFEIPECYYHKICGIRFHSPNEEAFFSYKESPGCLIDVTGTYQYLARRAENAGSLVMTGAKADITQWMSKGSVVIQHHEQVLQIRPKVIVDATGYSAQISRASGLHKGFARFGVGAEYDITTPHIKQDEIVLIVGQKYAPSGYAWVGPWGKNRVRVGVGLIHPDTKINPKEKLNLLMQDLPKMGIDNTGYIINEYHFGLIPSQGFADRISGRNILAIGDAAGVASLVAGEGIRTSMESGKIAAEVISRSINSRGKMSEYENIIRKKHGTGLWLGRIINKRLSSSDDASLDSAVRILSKTSPEFVVNMLQSKFSLRDAVRIFSTRPQLWPELVKNLIR
ncbi:MAG TPA: NAD(P)/FAD-dependent oxidoreductase [Candidatus Paceibacterota bacterium]